MNRRFQIRFSSRRRRFPGGLTLIELLSVIVIISLVAGAAMVRLGPIQENVALRSFAASMKELDGRARLHALTGERVKIEVDEELNEIHLIAFERDELLSRERLPHGVRIRFVVGREGTSSIVFDRLGRSPDYEIEVAQEAARIVWQVRGDTGLIVEGGTE